MNDIGISNSLALLIEEEQNLQSKLDYDEIFGFTFFTLKKRHSLERKLRNLKEQIDQRISNEVIF